MNTRSLIDRASILVTPAFLLAAVACVFSCASAEANCGSHAARPAVTLEWQSASSPLQGQVPSRNQPSCSGRNCPGSPASPLVTNPDPDPYRDLFAMRSTELVLVPRSKYVAKRSTTLRPIGRETKIERPPCCPAMTAIQL